MNSVGIAGLNIILVFLFCVEKKEMIPLLEIVFILAIRLVWRFRKTKPEIEKKILCKFIGPEDFSAKKNPSQIIP